MRIIFFLMVFLPYSVLLAVDCESKKMIGEYKPHYASFFSIRYYDQFKIVTTGQGENIDRVIVADQALSCSTELFVFTGRASRFVATSTTHLSFLNTLKIEPALVGFQGVDYIYNPAFKKKIVKDINFQLNAEELISLKPDLVMAYTANITGVRRLQDLRKLKIPIVLNYDFEEKHPLGRAEWIIFNSVFFNKDDQARREFNKIEKSYNELKRLAATKRRKKILVGDIQNGKWVTCGGSSDLGILISDAGGKLLFDSESNKTQYLSLEKVLKLEEAPDLWLSQNNWLDSNSVRKDFRYEKFNKIPLYNNVNLLNAHGFNDYWETGVARPDLILKDLLVIFHSEKIPNFTPRWYKDLK